MKKSRVLVIACAFIIALLTKGFDLNYLNQETNSKENTKSTVQETISKEVSNNTNKSPLNDKKIKIHVIDVGQADSIFIELPNEQTMLIDAGNNSDDETVIDYINNLNYDKIDYIVGTHPHEDHIGGLDAVIDTFNIGKVYLPKAENKTKTFEDVLLAIQKKNLKINTAKAGVNILNSDGLKVDIISPVNSSYSEINDYSAVIKITYLNKSFLFMGDAEKLNEQEITADVNADVIKIGHHGSDSSSSEEFLKKVSPDYAIISVGADNDYGHPHDVTLNLLKKMNIDVYRTDISGTITVISDGQNIEIEKTK